ncbi:unnamed protein product [Adineta steineri]|uniref:Hydrophobin n=1 Tax=Adineta steineri TaxID=433720 RepID=A0A819ZQU7_9BILA|nr:unnamed protein product [Adineta steineri]CAF4167055.1 unnamed protein product [Adineta steineri]
MQISKYLCVMIIGAIVIAASASPLRKKRSCKDNSGQQPSGSSGTTYYVAPQQNSYTSQQSSQSNTVNNCQAQSIYCCNNVANSNTAQLADGSGNSGASSSNQKSQQLSCTNYMSTGSGSQTNGCQQTTYCCQGNSGNSLVNLSCSPITLSLGDLLNLNNILSNL